MNVTIVIPNYNGEHIIGRNLNKVIESAKNYSEGEIEIIVSDDNSVDNSVKEIKDIIAKEKNIRIKLIENSKNLGFSSNVNKAVSEAKNEIIILLNSDVSPHINFIKPLIAHFSDPDVFAVGCKDESIEAGKIVNRGRGMGKWNKGFLIHRAGDLNSSTTLWASGGSSAFRKSIWDSLSGLDPLFNPFYWEDIDISYRAQKAGYKVVFEKNAIVRHEHEKGVIKSNYSDAKIKQIAYRNQFIFIWKNSDLKTIIFHILWFPYHFLKSLLRIDGSFFKGFFDSLILLPKIVKKRIIVQKSFVKSDADIINSL